MKGFQVKQEKKVPPPSHRDPLRPRLRQTSTDGRNVFSSLWVQTVWSRTKCLQNSTYFNGSTGKRGDCIKEETEFGGLPSITTHQARAHRSLTSWRQRAGAEGSHLPLLTAVWSCNEEQYITWTQAGKKPRPQGALLFYMSSLEFSVPPPPGPGRAGAAGPSERAPQAQMTLLSAL